jgi:hypothetical protein
MPPSKENRSMLRQVDFIEKLVLPDRIELFAAHLLSLKYLGFLCRPIHVVYQRHEHCKSPRTFATTLPRHHAGSAVGPRTAGRTAKVVSVLYWFSEVDPFEP